MQRCGGAEPVGSRGLPAGRTGWDLTGRAAAFGAGAGLALAAAAVAGYVGVVTGAAPLDVARGRRTRALGPLSVHVAAPRELVFDLIAAPYLGRPTRATAAKLTVLERGADMVLAEHYTPVSGGLRATTTETVRFERPDRVTFRLVRGPVPYVVEEFTLTPSGGGHQPHLRRDTRHRLRRRRRRVGANRRHEVGGGRRVELRRRPIRGRASRRAGGLTRRP